MSSSSIQQPCPRCQFPLNLGVSTCPQCGLNLLENAAAPAEVAAFNQPLPDAGQQIDAPAIASESAEAPAIPGDPSVPDQYAVGGTFPPPAVPLPPPPVKRRRGRLIVGITLAVLLVVIAVAGGSAAYILTRPKPVIQVQSSYAVGKLAAGAHGTSFHVTGQQFSDNATVVFLLDGQPIADAQSAHSDANGSAQADVNVSSTWTIGKHTITARDNQNYATKVGIPVQIVAPGVAGTPGPNGAPTDSASFSLSVMVQPQISDTGEQLESFQTILSVTGQPGPAGGTVCQQGDDGTPQSQTYNISGTDLTYVETMAFTCSGHYQSGQLTYTETLTMIFVRISNGETCGSQNKTSIPYEQWDGTFSSDSTIDGTFTQNGLILPCSRGSTFTSSSLKGTWVGTK